MLFVAGSNVVVYFVWGGWTITVGIVIGPRDGISYKAEQGSVVSCYHNLLTADKFIVIGEGPAVNYKAA